MTAVVLGAGALAGAVGAILGLLPDPPPPDTVDRVTVDDIRAASPVALARYRLTADGAVALGSDAVAEPVVLRLPVAAPAGEPAAGSNEEPTGGPSGDPSEEPTADPTGDPTEGPTEGPTDGPTGTDGPTATGPETTTPDPSEGGRAVTSFRAGGPPVLLPESVTPEHARRVVERATEEALEDPLLGDCEGGDCEAALQTLMSARLVGNDGEPVDAVTVAEQVLAELKQARRAPGPGSGSPAGEPLGVAVIANVSLDGLKGKTVEVSWSMWEDDGTVRLHRDWLDDRLAYGLRPTVEHVTRTVDLWIPLPPEPGPYVVRVQFTVDGDVVATATSNRFL